MSDIAIKVQGLKKLYKLGEIGGTTLNAALQSWWARKRGKEDPNLQIGQSYSNNIKEFWALNGIDLEVKKGEALGIIGSNGAGKSTFLKVLSRITAPTEGDIWLNGRISSMLEVGTGFHGEMTGRENIYMNGAILGMTRKEIEAKIESIIDFSECRKFIDTPVKRYSSGMYVKLAFAVASHLDSEIMIMDEVLAVGDAAFQKKCLKNMHYAATTEGRTVLYVSHNMATIRNLCSRCIVLNEGKIIFDGDVEKAIELYMALNTDKLVVKYDFSQAQRSSGLGEKVHIDSLTFVGTEEPRYFPYENMVFRIKWTGIEDVGPLRVRLTILYADGTCVGMTESKAFAEQYAGQERENTFSCSLKNLANGTYYFSLTFFVLGENGYSSTIDAGTQTLWFEIRDYVAKDHSRWLRQHWGSVRLDDVEIIPECFSS